MYYSNGNYEAFARPRKPKGVENKTACFIGSGLAALSGAAFRIRNGQIGSSSRSRRTFRHAPRAVTLQ